MKYHGPISDPKDLVTKQYCDTKYSASNVPPYPVTSVNGQTGAVTVAAGMAYSPGIETTEKEEVEGYVGPFLVCRLDDVVGGEVVCLKANTSICYGFSDGGSGTYTFDDFNHNWSAICYGGGKTVAVAKGETGSICFDGHYYNWTNGTLPESLQWGGIAYGGGKFVAIPVSDSYTSKNLAYSTDGINWTTATITTTATYGEMFSGIAYGNGKFVIITKNRRMYYSTNATSWTQVSLTSSTGKSWERIIFANGRFVVFAANTYVGFSTDGINWTVSSQDSGSDGYSKGVYVGFLNGFFIRPYSSYMSYYQELRFNFSKNPTYWKEENVTITTYASNMPNDLAVYFNEVDGRVYMTSSRNGIICRVSVKAFFQDGVAVARIEPTALSLADGTTATKDLVVAV